VNGQAEPRPGGRAILSLVILSGIVGLNTVDRNMFGLLLPQIQQDIAISDAALGLLVGPAFMIVYSVAGLPLAWLADRTRRRTIVTAGLALWSVVTLLTGFAQNLTQLLIARMALGAGEASNMAPTSALIGDLFRGRYRVIAMAVFAAGGPLAIMVFFPLIGAVTADHGWRAAYPLMGAIGLLVALLTLLLVPEPPRENPAPHQEHNAEGMFRAALAVLRTPGFMLLAVAGTMISINLGAVLAWLPSFMQRVHNLDAQQTGTLLGLYKGGFGVAATLAAGVVVTFLMRQSRRWLCWAPMLFCVGLVPAQLMLLLSDDPAWWHVGLALDSALMSAVTPCLFALLITLVDPRIRAIGAALYLLIFNLVGQSVGPFLVGALNDGAFAHFGAEAVRYSLLTAPAFAAVAAVLLLALSLRMARSEVSPQPAS
jgi:predicted MFS family arabinose efflux permease